MRLNNDICILTNLQHRCAIRRGNFKHGYKNVKIQTAGGIVRNIWHFFVSVRVDIRYYEYVLYFTLNICFIRNVSLII